MNKIVGLVIFALGAVTGIAVSKSYYKKVYETLAREEIDSVKETFAKREAKSEKADAAEQVESASEIISQERYTPEEKEAIAKANAEPYIITPDEFGEKDGYETISYTWYADGILADDCDFMVEDMGEAVGFDCINHFGEYEDDSVFVRNDARECDYEILSDSRRYVDVAKTKPYLQFNAED